MASLVRPLIVFIVCELFALASGASIPDTTESGPWCSLAISPEFVGSMECKFSEEVQYIQVDYYPFDSQDPPVIAVSCDQSSCEPNAKFTDMLKVRGSPSKQLLTLTLHGVPKIHAGKYRCLAQSSATSQTTEGLCSLRFPFPGSPWCSLAIFPEFVGSMECKFSEEVQFIQVDYYPFDSQDPPVIAVSCDQSSCEPNAKFTDMLKVRGSPSKQLLTLTLHGVPKIHAGKYRCLAQSSATSQTTEGLCSLRFPDPGPWCSLAIFPEFVGSMECKFSEEVQYIQVDYYPFDSQDPPVIAVSCDQSSCEPNANFADMLKVRGSLSKQLLTLTLHGVPEAHAGKYRCQALSITNFQTVEGFCSLRFPDPVSTGASHDITTESPAPKKESNILYVLLVLLVLPIVPTVILLLCICKRKSLGPWNKRDLPLDDTVGPAVGAGQRLSYPEGEPLMMLTKESAADKSFSAGHTGDREENAREDESRIILDDGKDTGDSERQSVGKNVVTSTGEASTTGHGVIANNRDGDVSEAHRSGSDVVRMPTCETNEDNMDISLNVLRRQFE